MDLSAFSEWLSHTSLPWIGAILIVTVLAMLFVGHFARTVGPRPPQESDALLTSSVLGLLALLLSFTFAVASERFEARRLLVQQEANAIGTMYLRAQLLEEPYRGQISRTLIDYTDNRIQLARAHYGQAGELLVTNDRLLREFWAEAAAAFPSIRDLDFSSTFYDSVNLVIDLDATRKSARLARVPPSIFLLLFVYVAASAALLGYFAQSRRGVVQSGLFLGLLVLFLAVIVDIDQPTIGAVQESQGPMERLRATLQGQ